MTNLTDFSDDELAQILDAPGAVLKGATLADGQPGAIRFLREAASGAKVFREAQQHENAFIRAVAIALRERIKEDERRQLAEPDRADDAATPPADVAAPAGTAVPAEAAAPAETAVAPGTTGTTAPVEAAPVPEASPAPGARVRPDPERETARAVELTEGSMALLRARADAEDAAAYAEWLVRIADKVVRATSSREGGFFSRRVAVSASEQVYIDRITVAAGR